MITPPYSTGGYVAGNLATVRTLITEIKNELGANLIDWSQLMIDAGLDAATLVGGDGIHVNDACHLLVYNALVGITGT
jgi:lysophospholipase L1-like esterase